MNVTPRVEDLLRELAPQVLGVLARRFGDFADAEDAVQEALLSAALHWPTDGVPDNPRAWLLQVGQRKLTDLVRSNAARGRRESAAGHDQHPDVPDTDDSLALLFLCCHPSLTPASAIPLTLRAFGGLTTAEIARGLLVPEPTMAQRISRAKQRIATSGLPFALPSAEELPTRLRSVLQVLYLIFNEGYASSSGADVARTELSAEAIRLCRALSALLPDDPEVTGLLALMLLTDARRPARTGLSGELVPLAVQDRALWSADLIAEGVALVTSAMQRGRIGDYQLQAAIAALHDEAPSTEATDWRQILALYGLLERMTGNPVVTLNRAIAAAMVDGPAAGLAMLEPLDQALSGNHRLDAVRGHLLEQAGDLPAAVTSYRSAAARTTSIAERGYLLARAARIAPAATHSSPDISGHDRPPAG